MKASPWKLPKQATNGSGMTIPVAELLHLTKSSDDAALSSPVLVGEVAAVGSSISPDDGVGVASGSSNPVVVDQGVATYFGC